MLQALRLLLPSVKKIERSLLSLAMKGEERSGISVLLEVESTCKASTMCRAVDAPPAKCTTVIDQ